MGGDAPLHVVATAGHVDHGKSALILGLTGIDPDRWAEEKRRGLTIDLGFAWTTLPSGRDIGFVDVPGHERFIRNMLAGVGPVRLVLFVVAADEGWKPQSEEHLGIVDVLGAEGAVVAVTKRDLVDAETLTAREAGVRERLSGTVLERARIVACSSHTGEGIDELRAALDEMVASAPQPESTGRPRQFVDRVFTIKGAGTVVTGTLTGGSLRVGAEAEVLPSGHRARIRGLQTHKRALEKARPVSRVAVNLTGTPKEDLERGDVLVLPGQWRPTRTIEGWIRPVRGLARPLTERGAYKLYLGSAECDVRLRLYEATRLGPDDRAWVRMTLSRPLVADFGDAFVLRDAGRRQTVAGGRVLDAHPPARAGGHRAAALARRESSDRSRLAGRIVEERGAVRESELPVLTGMPLGAPPDGTLRLGSWVAGAPFVETADRALRERLAAHHATHPLQPGLEVAEARSHLADRHPLLSDPGLAEAMIDALVSRGGIVRDGTWVRLPEHRATTEGREDADRLVAAVDAGGPTPPTAKELAAQGFGTDLIAAVAAEGRLVRVSADLVMATSFVARAQDVVRASGTQGISVSAFREALGTSRKYAVPLLEYFDTRGLTRRTGDVRVLRTEQP